MSSPVKNKWYLVTKDSMSVVGRLVPAGTLLRLGKVVGGRWQLYDLEGYGLIFYADPEGMEPFETAQKKYFRRRTFQTKISESMDEGF